MINKNLPKLIALVFKHHASKYNYIHKISLGARLHKESIKSIIVDEIQQNGIFLSLKKFF
jgi:hypothetical protein